MKILIIGDIHIGDSRESTSQPGIVRQANSQAEATLSALIPRFNASDFDLVVHIGDALRDTYVKDVDRSNTTKALKLLSQINTPKIHLLGNHELRAFSLEEIEEVYRKSDCEPLFFGMKEFENLRVIWLDIELHTATNAHVPQETLDWIASLPPSQKPTIVFSHHSLVPIDGEGSFYFQQAPQEMHLGNGQHVVEALRSVHPKLCINGHVHWLSHQEEERVHYISAPSFTENFAAEQFPENNPGIFSVLEVNDKKFVFSSYSGEFCFGKIQGKI